MKLFKQLFNFYINSSIHVAVAVFMFIEVASLHLNNPTDQYIKATIFFGTIVGYNFLKFDLLRKPKILFSKSIFKPVFIFTIICMIGLVYNFLQMRNNYQTAFLLPFLVTIFYGFLRHFAFVKIFLVAFCITYVVVEIPVIDVLILRSDVYLFEIKLFFIMSALMIPFEIYDSQFDAEYLKTIPQKYGIKNSKIIGIAFVVLSFFNFKNEIKNNFNLFIIDLIIGILITLFILFSSTKKSKYFTSFWVESVPIFWVIIIGISNIYPY